MKRRQKKKTKKKTQQRFIVEDLTKSAKKMTSTLKGITLKGSAEIVAEFFCEYSDLFVLSAARF